MMRDETGKLRTRLEDDRWFYYCPGHTSPCMIDHKILSPKYLCTLQKLASLSHELIFIMKPICPLQTVQLRITVAEFQTENKTPSLGHVIVGAHTSGTEATHWNQMMTSLRKPVAMWHFMRK